MAVACTRMISFPYVRSVFAACKGEQLKPLLSKVRVNPVRHYASRSGFRHFSVIQSSLLHYGLGGFAAGAAYTYYQFKLQDQSPILNETDVLPFILDTLPPFAPARQINIPTDNTGLKLVLYQYPTCPFCCKVRAFLDYYGISYDVVEVDPVLRQQIKWSDYKKVPILLAQLEDGRYLQLNDSSMITSALKTYLLNPKQSLLEIAKCYPRMSYKEEDGSVKSEIQNCYFPMSQTNLSKESQGVLMDEVKWRRWADNKLVHVLSPNVYQTTQEALQSFEWFAEVGEWDRLFPSWERFLIVNVGAYAMWLISKQLKKRYMLRDNVRESLYEELVTWTRQLDRRGTPFCGGEKPNLADIAVYGVLSSIEGCQAFKDALENTNIGKWFYSMKELMKAHAGSNSMTGR